MRLIDADALTELFLKEREAGRDYMSPDYVIHTISGQQTAYDVDKIIEELKENTHDMEICEEVKPHCFEDIPYKMVKLEDVIEIIKAGGLE